MAGIYIHVPFCKTRCIYCDFFTQTSTQQKNSYIDAVCKELVLRNDYLGNESIDTIYFGGGTPSMLSLGDLDYILDAINKTYSVNENSEITLEANPDDLDIDYLKGLQNLDINRLSVGIQSFDDTELQFLNRRHSSRQAIEVIASAQNIGFDNISIDLMYGLPAQTIEIWQSNLEKAINLDIQHVSAYHLIYEEGTKLFRLLEDGIVRTVDEETSLEMFSILIDRLSAARFIHYEISNFGKENFFSRHNSSYWLGQKYLGIGPSAHSFNEINRCWNVASISGYVQGIENNLPEQEIEDLDRKTKYNDYILTGLRTIWGIDVDKLNSLFGENIHSYFRSNIEKYIATEDVIFCNNNYKLSRKGIFISDTIMSDLMIIR